MAFHASSTSSRTPFGKHVIHTAVTFGHAVNRLENRVLHSRSLASIPLGVRQIGFQALKVLLMLAVASVAIFLAIGMLAVWTLAALPISADKKPRIHEVSHPRHQASYPELYDEHGSLG
ncbi:hypothetical protein [Pseudomonas sp. NFX224]|uniref:hypothetical protein n=1 Tax=Pseudomonas sp. NFX224 TaxID=3402862 RepID=UPI003AFA48AE